MFEAFAWPLAFVGLAAGPVLLWLHRRAHPTGQVPFSAFFLLPRGLREGLAGRRWRSPWLLALRLIALGILIWQAAGPLARRPGTLLISAGPVRPEPGWATPIVSVRAGHPPTLVASPERIAVVAGSPDWAGALLLGRQSAPDAAVVFRPRTPSARIVGGGAAVRGAQVEVAVQAEGPKTLRLVDAKGAEHVLAVTDGLARLTAPLPPGGAVVIGGDADPFAMCVPDARPMPVAETGWPAAAAFDDALDALEVAGLAVRVPLERAVWWPAGGPLDPEAQWARWAPFGPDRTHFHFPGVDAGDARGAEPLLPADDSPTPGATVRVFTPLAPAATPTWYAGDAVAADRGTGESGRFVRFGFFPADSDLPETGAWPVHLRSLLEADRAARAACRVHRAGDSLTITATAPVTLRHPGGIERSLAPVGDALTLDGLDEPGLYRLTQGDHTAWLAVQPGPTEIVGPPDAANWVVPAAPATPDVSVAWVLGAVAVLLGALLAGRRGRSAMAWGGLACALAAATDPRFGLGSAGAVIVAVDTSGSMPRAETREALAALQAALGPDQPLTFVWGDDAVRGVGPAPDLMPGRGTRSAPILHAALGLAGASGAVVFVTDGRAPDLPVAGARPVFPLLVSPGLDHGDTAVLGATATRQGDQVYVRARLLSDRSTDADVEIDRYSTELRLEPGRERTVSARIRAVNVDAVPVRVQAHDDVQPLNDRRLVPIDGDVGARLAVIADASAAAGPQAWGEAAGFSVATFEPEALGTKEPRLWGAQALVIHDVPVDALPAGSADALSDFVRGGGLLLLSGRARAFGPGGWAGQPLERLSPLTSDPRPPGAGRLGLLLALDRSGSMASEAGGIGPEAVGRLARGLAAGLRPEDDRVGVLAFGTQAQVLLAPTPAGAVAGGVLPVPAGHRGGTYLVPALLEAIAVLQATEADARVLVVVTDGKFADGGEPMPLEALRGAGIRLLAVLVGEDVETAPLEALAEATGGRFVIGQVGEVLRLAAAGVAGLGEGGLLAGPGAPTPGPAWGARVGGDAPRIEGRVRVRERPSARVLARVDGEPFLAEWQVGAGRVVALATDAWALPGAGWAALLAPARAAPDGEARLLLDADDVVLVTDPEAPLPTDATLIDAAGGHSPLC
jgi:Mg-chelatase subunit ChlD